MGKCRQSRFKPFFGLPSAGAAGGDICSDSEIDEVGNNQGPADDEIDTAATQGNRTEEDAQSSAFSLDR